MIRRGGYDASQAFEDAWQARARSTSRNAEVRDLVRTAERLCEAAVAEPSPEFTQNLRARLMAEAADVLVARPADVTPVRPRPSRTVSGTRRRLAGLTAALVASVGVVGTVASSASAVPGDMLYPVKRGVENVQVVFHRSDDARGEFRLQQARERLAEAQALDVTGDAEHLAQALNDFTSQAQAGSDDLFSAYQSEGTEDTIEKVNTFVAEASLSLASLSSTMPTAAQESYSSAATLISGLAAQTSALCASCSSADIGALIDTVDSLVGAAVPQTVVPDEVDSDPASVTTPTVTTAPTTPTQNSPGTTTSPSGPGTTTNSGGTSTGLGGVVGDTLEAVVGEDGLVGVLLNGLLGGGK